MPALDLTAPDLPTVIDTSERDVVLAEYHHHVARAREKHPEGEAAALAAFREKLDTTNDPIDLRGLLARLSPEKSLDVWRTTPPNRWSAPGHAVRWLIAILGADAVEGARTVAANHVDPACLVDIVAPWVALHMAKSRKAVAFKWLVRHERVAAAALVHSALTKGPWSSGGALRWMARRPGAADRIRATARELWGEGIDAHVIEVLRPENEGFSIFDRPLPKVYATLPKIRLSEAEGGAELDPGSMEAIARMCATPLYPWHPAMREVLATCDGASMAALARALFDEWVEGGMATQNRWIVHLYAILLGSAAPRELGRFARTAARARSSRERGCAAVAAEALGALGTDAAIAELGVLARVLPVHWAREAAQDELERIALEREIDVDALVASGRGVEVGETFTLDYGARSFTATLDATLSLELSDDSGKALDALPRPGKKDDAARAKAAKEQLRDLREQAETALRAETARLEAAMIDEHRLSETRFREHVLDRSLSFTLASRLVWGAFRDGALIGTFRIAEDRTLADAEDRPFALDGAEAGIVHPLHLDDALRAKWARVFADYEIVPPFEQLDRATFGAEHTLKGVAGPAPLLDLTARGWRIGIPHYIELLEKSVPGGSFAVHLQPGFFTDMMDREQKLSFQITSGAPSAVALSEAFRDLTSVLSA